MREDCVMAAVVDDDDVFREKFLQQLKELFIITKLKVELIPFPSAESFLEEYRKSPFDVVFLDIDMPGMSGIELASEVRKRDMETALIFVSAHEHFVFESIHYAPFRFIRKGELDADVQEAVDAYSRMMKNKHRFVTIELHTGVKNMINLSRIVYFYTIRHSIYLYDSDHQSIELAPRYYNMSVLEEMLCEHGYIRTHKSYLLNFRYIYLIQSDKILLTEEGSVKEHDTIPLSRRRTHDVKETYRLLIRGEQSV